MRFVFIFLLSSLFSFDLGVWIMVDNEGNLRGDEKKIGNIP
jgi:hypothetical protein